MKRRGEYKGVTYERLPSGRILENHRVGLTDEARSNQFPQLMTCDFCSQTSDRHWVYPTYAFSALLNLGRFRGMQCEAGEWGACVYCHALLKDGRVDLTAARAYSFDARLAPGLDRLHWCVLAAQRGEVYTWESGQRVKTGAGSR